MMVPNRKLTKEDLVKFKVLAPERAENTFKATINDIEYGRTYAATQSDKPWVWLVNNPLAFAEFICSQPKPRVNTYKHIYTLFNNNGLSTEDWYTVRGHILKKEVAGREDRTEALTEKDMRFGTLLSLMRALPKGSGTRIWMALMLMNPSMRGEGSSLIYTSTLRDPKIPEYLKRNSWCRGIVSPEMIILTKTKLSSRSRKLQVIPMSKMAKDELDAYVSVNGLVSGEHLLIRCAERPTNKIPGSALNFARYVKKITGFSENSLSANVFRRAFCREVLPLIWSRHGYAVMVAANEISGHGMGVVEAYAAMPRHEFASDIVAREENGIFPAADAEIADVVDSIGKAVMSLSKL